MIAARARAHGWFGLKLCLCLWRISMDNMQVYSLLNSNVFVTIFQFEFAFVDERKWKPHASCCNWGWERKSGEKLWSKKIVVTGNSKNWVLFVSCLFFRPLSFFSSLVVNTINLLKLCFFCAGKWLQIVYCHTLSSIVEMNFPSIVGYQWL